MQSHWPLLLLAWASPCEAGLGSGARHLRAAHGSHQRTLEFASSAEWVRIRAQEQEDIAYWDEEWVAARSELLRLQECAGDPVSSQWKGKLSELEAAGGARMSALVSKLGLASRPDQPAQVAMHDIVGPATLTQLNGLYEDSKKRIAELNLREEKSKAQYAEKQRDHQASVARIEEGFKGNKNAVFQQLMGEGNYFIKYWKDVRDRNKRQFHTFRKIQDTIMAKDKALSEQYIKAMTGQNSKAPDMSQLQKAVDGAAPLVPEPGSDVALLQGARKDATHFVDEALKEIEERHDETDDWDL